MIPLQQRPSWPPRGLLCAAQRIPLGRGVGDMGLQALTSQLVSNRGARAGTPTARSKRPKGSSEQPSRFPAREVLAPLEKKPCDACETSSTSSLSCCCSKGARYPNARWLWERFPSCVMLAASCSFVLEVPPPPFAPTPKLAAHVRAESARDAHDDACLRCRYHGEPVSFN